MDCKKESAFFDQANPVVLQLCPAMYG